MNKVYPGLTKDANSGLTPLGKIVMDARIFQLIPDTEECSGWDLGRMQLLYDRVHQAWEPYGHLPSRLPPELRERHGQVYDAAVAKAKAGGWDPAYDYSE